jgi:hypothetical protein
MVVGLVEPRILSGIDRWLVSIKNPGYPVVCRLMISEGSGATERSVEHATGSAVVLMNCDPL